MDPPYSLHNEGEVLKSIADNDLLADGGIIIMEMSKDRDLSFVEDTQFAISRVKQYKTNEHVFLEKK